ncbi:MAG: hypothetical protein LBB56_00050 [Chitinispirillales bacterium]|jgi:hypothetical protein|nr:hypothetical protein [Chitinispirillales bacterium]
MKHHHRNNYIHTETKAPDNSTEAIIQTNKKESNMHTAFRVKATVNSSKLEIDIPELELISGREVEVIILAKGIVDDGSKPSEGRQNSSHVAGSIILDDEALRQILGNNHK